MQRVFYPVGQGGFHSETFDAESYVYDCGARPQINSTIIDDYVSSVKSEKIKIITIFISHFDCDHVNGIPELIEKLLLLNKKITLIIPYRNTVNIFIDFVWLINSNPSNNLTPLNTTIQFYINPERYFTILENKLRSNKDKLIKVITVKKHNIDTNNKELKSYSAENIREFNTIDSGVQLLALQGNSNIKRYWRYISYNFPFCPLKIANLQYVLATNGVLIEFSKFIAGHKSNFIILFRKNWAKILKACYRILDPNHNNASMVIFSFVDGQKDGCVYTGDYDLKTKKYLHQFCMEFNKYATNISLLQIPHHGSKYNLDSVALLSLFTNKPNKFFVNYGAYSPYRKARINFSSLLSLHSIPIEEITNISQPYSEII